MASDPDLKQQRRAMGDIAVWAPLIGLVLIALVAAWAVLSGRVGGFHANNLSDQPAPSATSRAHPNGTTTTGASETGNTATGDAAEQGSGPPGSATGSPRGSSGNISGSNPPNGAERSDTMGSSTR